MSNRSLQTLVDRTVAKLKYAEVHLNELKQTNNSDRSRDFGRAHQESFLFHLLGAKDAFLQELNKYYGCTLSDDKVSLGKIRDELRSRGLKREEVTEIYSLENDTNSWLYHAKTIRHHSTHIAGVPWSHYVGGENEGETRLRNPVTNEEVGGDFVSKYDEWLANMKDMTERLRKSATSYAGSNKANEHGSQ